MNIKTVPPCHTCPCICCVHFQNTIFILMLSICCYEENVKLNHKFYGLKRRGGGEVGEWGGGGWGDGVVLFLSTQKVYGNETVACCMIPV